MCFISFKKSILCVIEEIMSFSSLVFSKTFLYSIYFNFRYLPFDQAKYLPIFIFDTQVYGKPNIKIESSIIYKGMIRIGRQGRNVWRKGNGTFTFWNGTIIFKGSCRLTSCCHLRVLDGGELILGDNFYASSYVNIHCAENIQIGNDVYVAWDVLIMDTDYHKFYKEDKASLSKPTRPIIIGRRCWIAAKSMILKGTILNDDTIVGGGSVVQAQFKESGIIIKGNPAVSVKGQICIKPDLFW